MKQKHFFDVQFDFPIVGIVSALLLIGILSVYVAVSHDYPQMVWSFLGQQLAWIGMGCFICLIVCTWTSLNGTSLDLLQSKSGSLYRGKKLGGLRKYHPVSAIGIYENSFYSDVVSLHRPIFTTK